MNEEELREVGIRTGLVGEGIQLSLSPALHEGEAAALGFEHFCYHLLDLERLPASGLEQVVTAVRALGFAGINVTHPVKQAVIPLLDELSPDAAQIGAVNTVVFGNGRAVGHNTDWFGFAELARRSLVGETVERVVQLGAGGAGAAVAYGQLRNGVEDLVILDVDEGRAESVAASLRDQFSKVDVRGGSIDQLPSALATASGIVNTTPLGMAQHPGTPVPKELLAPRMWVIDIVYPWETQLMKDARAIGARATGGAGMTVFQAAEAFRLFTGIEPDSERMLAHARTLVDVDPR